MRSEMLWYALAMLAVVVAGFDGSPTAVGGQLTGKVWGAEPAPDPGKPDCNGIDSGDVGCPNQGGFGCGEDYKAIIHALSGGWDNKRYESDTANPACRNFIVPDCPTNMF